MVTIASSSLMLHAGAHSVSRAEVLDSPTPDNTDTHYPIPHGFVLKTIQSSLRDRGWSVVDEAHALMGNGLRYFGLLRVAPDTSVSEQIADPTYGWVMGLRNSHDKTFPAGAILGTQVFVCDNLAFSGRSVFQFARKHTRFIERDMVGKIAQSFGALSSAMHNEAVRIERYREHTISDEEVVHDFLIRAMDRRALTPQMLPHVLREWRREDGPGGLAGACAESDPAFGLPTAWRLLNAFTEVEKSSPSPVAGPERSTRMMSLLDGLVGLT